MTHDFLVYGAGPAGSVVARRLALTGARVALIGAASRPGWEGLSARSRALLIEEGLEEADCIKGPFARSGQWTSGRAVTGSEWLVER
jgi:flavin-dependent dehydrogenase